MNPVIIASVIAGILGPVLTLFIKNYFDNKQNKPDIVAEALETSTKIMVKLDAIKEEFKADRIWITQFHNGGNFYPTGKSMAKFSVIYETVNIGVGSIQNMFQNIQVNLFSKSINELLENDSIQIADYKDETIATFGLKYIADDTGCKSGYLFTIKTIDNKFIGILGLDYTKKKAKLTEENINELLNYATAIGGVLSGHKEI
tara:strand:- start:2031 stop:2636 length:606 start_codon:yes stop_codon:yes gene_type:complete